jgi:hypothetical protein
MGFCSPIVVFAREKVDNFTPQSPASIIKLGQAKHFNAWKTSD